MDAVNRKVYLGVLLLCAALSTYAQNAPPAQLRDTDRRTLVHAAAEALRQGYVFPDIGERAAEAESGGLCAAADG